jgi:hypothetical protein
VRRMNRGMKLQSSFELLVTLSIGLAVLLPVVVVAFVQIASANSSLSAIEAQQAASKITAVATLVGSEGPPAKQLIQITIPAGVRYIYVGATNNIIGNEVIFEISSPRGLSYITSYTPVNITGNLGGITATGTYLVNITAESSCPQFNAYSCVYITPVV